MNAFPATDDRNSMDTSHRHGTAPHTDPYVPAIDAAHEAAYAAGLKLATEHAKAGRMDGTPSMAGVLEKATQDAQKACGIPVGTLSPADWWFDSFCLSPERDLQNSFESGYWAGHSDAHI
jgi:hypothetical protein